MVWDKMVARIGAPAGIDCVAVLDRRAGAVRAATPDAPSDLAAARRMALPGRARTGAVLRQFSMLLLRRTGRAERTGGGGVFDSAAFELDQRTPVYGPPLAAHGDCRRGAGPGRHCLPVRSADGRTSRRPRCVARPRDRVSRHRSE